MSEITKGMRPTYSQTIDLVQDCVRRMHDAGESHRMLARWISEGLDAAISRPEAIGEGVGVIAEFLKLRDEMLEPGEADDGEREESARYIIGLLSPLPSEGEKRMREALTEIRKSIRNAMGAIESNQVVDKDVHGTLKSVLARIDALSYQSGNGEGRDNAD